MSQSDKPIKIVLSATICLVASSALQGTTTTAKASPSQQWKDVQQFVDREAVENVAQVQERQLKPLNRTPFDPDKPGTYPALPTNRTEFKPNKFQLEKSTVKPVGPRTGLNRSPFSGTQSGTFPALPTARTDFKRDQFKLEKSTVKPVGIGTAPIAVRTPVVKPVGAGAVPVAIRTPVVKPVGAGTVPIAIRTAPVISPKKPG